MNAINPALGGDNWKRAHITPLEERLEKLSQQMPEEITSGDELEAITALGKALAKLLKDAEDLRVAEKEPHLAAGRQVDALFKPVIGEISAAKEKAGALFLLWRKKEQARLAAEAEAMRRKAEEEAKEKAAKLAAENKLQSAAMVIQAAANAKTPPPPPPQMKTAAGQAVVRKTWKCPGYSIQDLDLEALRLHFTETAIQAAIASFIKAGGRELRGATIEETESFGGVR